MKIFIITLFPEVISPYLESSIMRKAKENRLVSFSIIPLRAFGLGKHKQVDDAPYGGGKGMLLRPEPVFAAVQSVVKQEGEKPRTILLNPSGVLFKQSHAKRLSVLDSLLFISGHYEGIDERIRLGLADEEISIGPYVLTGGEIPTLALVDAVVRLIPGVLPQESTEDESFSDGLLEFPQYTRPPEFQGMMVPEVLTSGNHAAIKKWRRENALRRTVSRSPNLLENTRLTNDEKKFVAKLRKERKNGHSDKA